MPLPTPNENEQQDDFMSRCMGNDTMNSEYSDQKQRVAVCYSQWRKKHPSDKPPTQKAATYRYLAAVHSPYEYMGRFFAKIRLIDTSTSLPSEPKGERWRVTYEGLKNAIKRLLANKDLPLVGPPEKGHAATEQVAKPVSFNMPDGYADVTFEITDEKAKQGIKDKTWVHVSPEVIARESTIGPNGEAVLSDFDFQRLAFVEQGAFPQDTIQSFWDAEMLHQLRAELFSQSSDSGVSGEELTNGVSSTLIGPQDTDKTIKTQGGTPKLSEQKKDDKPNELDTMKAEITRLQGELAKSSQKLELFERATPTKHYQAEIDRLTKNFNELNEQMLAKETKERAVRIASLVQARVDAGLVDERDRAVEAKKYDAYSAEILDSLIQDFEAVATVRRSGGPKWQYQGARNETTLEDAVRTRMGFAPRKKESA